MIRLGALWEHLRGTYWAVPSAMAITSVGLAVGMIQLDQVLTADLMDEWSWVYAGGPEGARAVLSTIAASMITVAGVSFSITVVALTLAAQQFGPRLLRNFLRDTINQIVLGTFVSTFLYCLLVLRTVRGSDDEEFVPQLAVSVGVLLSIVSLGVLILFIHHVATSIQASRIIANVASDLEAAIDRLYPEPIAEESAGVHAGDQSTDVPPKEVGRSVVRSTTSGYVQIVDHDRLVEVARAHRGVVHVPIKAGAFVRKGSVLASVGPSPPDDEAPFRGAFIIGADRAGTQDATFFIEQLVELAVRALSPAINDPGTARTCIDRLEQALCQLAGRRIPSAHRYDRDGALRMIAAPVTFADFVDCAFDEIGRYGKSSVSVTCRLLDAVRNVGLCARRDGDRLALARQANAIAGRSSEVAFVEPDRNQIADRHRAALMALG